MVFSPTHFLLADTVTLQYFASVKPCVFTKFRLIQVLCDLIFAISDDMFCNLRPSPSYYEVSKVTLTRITLLDMLLLLLFSVCKLLPCLLCDFPARKILQSQEVWTTFTHKAAETSITAVGTALSGSTSMVHTSIITTPTMSHSHKPICLTIVIFCLRCCKHSQNLQCWSCYFSTLPMSQQLHLHTPVIDTNDHH